MPPLLTPRVATAPRPSQPKSPSPNYFSSRVETSGGGYLDSPRHTKSNWSPPSSTVRSTAAASPSIVPLDQNPEYDAFRQHTEGKAFNLGGLNTFKMHMPGSKEARSHSETAIPPETSRPTTTPQDMQPPAAPRHFLDPSTAELSKSPKRVLSPGSITEVHRRGSPASLVKHDVDRTTRHTSNPPENPARVKLPLDSLIGPHSGPRRAETLPEGPESDSGGMVTPQRVVNLLDSRMDDVLLLDLRVSTQYAFSHLAGALNLCIPTTLLKRPSFNVQKLAETFKDDRQRSRFENWRTSGYIIMYDASSHQMKDATICLNTIKKFQSEGFVGTLYFIQGGFNAFAKSFPSHVESGVDGVLSTESGASDGPEIAPVIGGCPMPATDRPANPFFGNIRQNMDLIGGVGQIPLKHPSKVGAEEPHYPKWLSEASTEQDQGKRVSNKFEQIERREKKRMEDALNGKVAWGTPKQEMGGSVQIAGLEKGNKNRYNNIWPFEHSRVRLQGVPKHGCDYFNASHIQASRSNKRYISTQAPIPGTFNDFWNVVWQEDVRVLVMLTAEKEGAQVKAHNYWDQKQYGPLHLDFLSEKRASLDLTRIHAAQKRPAAVKRASTSLSGTHYPLAPLDAKDTKSPSDQPFVIVRKFTLSHSRFPFEPMREITQLHYASWPDFGAPAHPAHLLGLVEQTDAVARAYNKTRSKEPEPAENKRPILVHCSAGCGRTGTFCTVDSVIDMLKRQRLSGREARQSSPMDVDGGSAKKRQSASGGADFFSAKSHHSEEGVDGAWVGREDLDLVERTVEDFRHQRISMVQSLRQFVLCYESIMEWLAEQEVEREE